MSQFDHMPTRGGTPPTQGEGVYKGVGSHIKHSIEDVAGVILATALRIPNAAKASKQLTNLTFAAFKAKFGRRMAELDQQISHLKSEHAETLNWLQQVRIRLPQTRERLPACRANHGLEEGQMVEVTFEGWQVRHKIEAIVLLLAMAVAIGASLLTAHANLTGSGIQVFKDNPLLPWSMAALAPLSGIAVKTIHEYLRTDWAIKTFTILLIAAMLTSIGLWIFLYSDIYHGLSSQITIGDLFDKPSLWDQIRDTAFVIVSLTTEILIGAALALRLSIIAGRYSPDYSHPNTEFLRLQKREKLLEKNSTEQATTLARLEGERAEYGGSLELQIQILTLAHDGRRAQADITTL
ncbi:MAG: hypothetical protein COB93_04625 [Sneathiella sp.]|nr:MAG: hypothetical protein COB93_04625 [Sneathiella sp.]